MSMSITKAQFSHRSEESHTESKKHASSVKRGDVNSLLTVKVLFSMNFYIVARLSKKSTTLQWWKACERHREEKGPFVEGEIWILHHYRSPAHSSLLVVTAWQSTRPHSSYKLRTRQISHQQPLFLTRRWNSKLSTFSACWEQPRKIASGVPRQCTKAFQQCFPKLGNGCERYIWNAGNDFEGDRAEQLLGK